MTAAPRTAKHGPRSVIRSVLAGLVLVLLVAGIPALLAGGIGSPGPGWTDLVVGDVSGNAVVAVLASLAWVAWAQFAACTLAETIAVLTRRPGRIRVPGVFAAQQHLAHLLVCAALLAPGLPAGHPGSTQHDPLPGRPVAAVTVNPPDLVTGAPGAPAGTAPKTAATRTAPTTQRRQPADGADQTLTHTVGQDGPGTLWDLAEHYLGDGRRWPQIWALNHGRQQNDGAVMTDPGLLRPGWTVLIPHAPAAESPADAEQQVTVHRGDTLTELAAEHALPGWEPIWQANHGRAEPGGRRFTDPDHIEPGWALTIPAPQQPAVGPAPQPQPVDHPSPAPTTGAAPETTPPDQTGSLEAQSIPGATTAPESRSTTETAGTPRDSDNAPAARGVESGVSIPGGWFGLPLAAAIAAAGTAVWVQRRRRWHPGPLDLDDLDNLDLIPLPGSIAAARAALREQAPDLIDPPRRYPTVAEYAADHYTQPLPPPGPDGLQLSGLTAPPRPGPAPEPVPDHEQSSPDPFPIATSDADGPASGIALSGPGADAAARALLVASLSAGSPEDPEAAGTVITTADTLTTLLGTGTVDVSPIPRLTVCGSLPEALAVAEAQVIDRRRTLDDHALDPTSARRAAATADGGTAIVDAPYPPLLPPVLLLTTTPEPRHHNRLTTLLALGKPLRIDAVILGDWPTGRPERLDRDGRQLPPGPPSPGGPDSDSGAVEPSAAGTGRVAVLDVATATELLQVIAEAHTGTPPRPALTAPNAEPPAASNGTAPTHTPPEPARQPVQQMAEEAETPVGKVRVRLLGGAAILNAAGEPVPGLRLHARELLVYLAVHRAGADLPDIMEAIWPTATVRRAQERLSTEVANLRRTLRTAAGDIALQPVINTGGRYHLNPELLDLDLWHLDDALRHAAASDLAQRREPLQAAVEAGVGPLANGYDYDWFEPHREHTRRQLIRARIHLADLTIATDSERAATLLDQAADLDPTNEDLARRHLDALDLLRDHEGRLRRLEVLTRALEAIDMEPGPAILQKVRGDPIT